MEQHQRTLRELIDWLLADGSIDGDAHRHLEVWMKEIQDGTSGFAKNDSNSERGSREERPHDEGGVRSPVEEERERGSKLAKRLALRAVTTKRTTTRRVRRRKRGK